MISVIIINYNTFNLTCNCIKSVIENTKEVEYEIILVDNNSTEKNSNTFKTIFGGEINFIQSNKNLGFAGGNNLGIQYSKGDFLLLLNSDTLLLEDSISKTYNYIKNITNLGAVTCKLLDPDLKKMQNAARPFYSLKLHFLKCFGLSNIISKPFKRLHESYNLNKNFACDWIWGTFFLFPKHNLKLMGGKLTEHFFMYSEDVEWSYLFHKNKLQNYYFADTAIIHYGGQSSNTSFRRKAIEKSHVQFLKMYYGYLPSIAAFLLFRIENFSRVIKRYKRRIRAKFKNS